MINIPMIGQVGQAMKLTRAYASSGGRRGNLAINKKKIEEEKEARRKKILAHRNGQQL